MFQTSSRHINHWRGFPGRRQMKAAVRSVCLLLLLSWGCFPGLAQIENSITGTVLSGQGDYSYSGRQYEYLNATPTVDDVITTTGAAVSNGVAAVNSAGTLIREVSSFGQRFSHVDEDSFSIGASAGIKPIWGLGVRQGLFGAVGPTQYKFGPFLIDSLSVGAGLMYSEYDGPLPRSTRFSRVAAAGDEWASILWTNFRISAYVTNRFALTLRPFIYYLPFENKIGYSGLTAGVFGFRSGINPNSSLQAAYRTRIGSLWEFSLYESFRAIMTQRALLNESLMYYAGSRDLSEYDTAGRYGFGAMAPPIDNSIRRTDFRFNDKLFDNNRIMYSNSAVARMTGTLGQDMTANFMYRRMDQWGEGLDHLGGWNSIRATLVQTRPLIQKYLSYNASTRDGSNLWLQWLSAGSIANIGPHFKAFVSGGHYWTTGGDKNFANRNSWIGRFGIEHWMGPNLWQSVSFGRLVSDPEYGGQYLADFARYQITANLSPRVMARLYMQQAKGERVDSLTASDYSSEAYGAMLTMIVSPKDTVNFLSTHEIYDRLSGRSGWSTWTQRLSYLHYFREDMNAHMYYQYQQGENFSRGNQDFSEHLIYLGMIKRF